MELELELQLQWELETTNWKLELEPLNWQLELETGSEIWNWISFRNALALSGCRHIAREAFN